MTDVGDFVHPDGIDDPECAPTVEFLDVLEQRYAMYFELLENAFGNARQFWPELDGETVYVGVLHEDASAKARAHPHTRVVLVPTDTTTTLVTIHHELAHLAIRKRREGGEDLPKTSEEFCSILAVARMPSMHHDEHRVPYLGEPADSVPVADYTKICARALYYREHSRDYIQQCKRWLGTKDADGPGLHAVAEGCSSNGGDGQ